jgi:hypothetical protein
MAKEGGVKVFTLKIDTSNDAFGFQPHYELARLLLEAAERVGQEETSGTLRDDNGNTVGHFKLTTPRKAVTR